MVPHREAQVKTWGDWWQGATRFAQDPLGRLSALTPTKEETDQARQRLIRGGIEETDENIAEAIKAARANAKKKIDTRTSAEKPSIQNPDGTKSSELTITVEADGKHYLIPTIIDGKKVDAPEAVKQWRAGKNLPVGIYATAAEAKREAEARTDRLGREMAQREEKLLEGIEEIPVGELNKPKPGFDIITTAVGPIRILKRIRGDERQKVVDAYVKLKKLASEPKFY